MQQANLSQAEKVATLQLHIWMGIELLSLEFLWFHSHFVAGNVDSHQLCTHRHQEISISSILLWNSDVCVLNSFLQFHSIELLDEEHHCIDFRCTLLHHRLQSSRVFKSC